MSSFQYLIYNGDIHLSYKFLISPDNRSFRYGDGFFETMKMIDGKIVLQDYHFERLFNSLAVMQFEPSDFFTKDYLLEQIQRLSEKNNYQSLARIRLTIFRGDGSIYDTDNNLPNYLIQSWPLPQFPSYNNQGFEVDIYGDARKTADVFSAIKSNNYLPYAMATFWYKKKQLQDALIVNHADRIAEATTSNIFIVKDGLLKTPRLGEGCIAGVVRRHLLYCLQQSSIPFEEGEITEDELLHADELFLTNAGFYIQWVKQCKNKTYTNEQSKLLYETFISPLLKQE